MNQMKLYSYFIDHVCTSPCPQGTPWFYLTVVEKELQDEMHQVSDMKYMHQQQLNKRRYQLTTADGQNVKTAVTKGAAGYITQ